MTHVEKVETTVREYDPATRLPQRVATLCGLLAPDKPLGPCQSGPLTLRGHGFPRELSGTGCQLAGFRSIDPTRSGVEGVAVPTSWTTIPAA